MKNLRSILMNAGIALLGVLMYVFMSQAYVTVSAMGMKESGTGYDLIDFDGGNSNSKLLAVSNLFICILAGLLIVVAVLNILVNLGVLKNDIVTKVLNYTTVALTGVTLLFAILSIVGAAGMAKDMTISFMGMSQKGTIGWACIVNFVLAIATAAVVTTEFVLTLKKK